MHGVAIVMWMRRSFLSYCYIHLTKQVATIRSDNITCNWQFITAKNVFEQQPCENDLYCSQIQSLFRTNRIMHITYNLLHFHKMHQLNGNPFPANQFSVRIGRKKTANGCFIQCQLTSQGSDVIEIEFWLNARSCSLHSSKITIQTGGIMFWYRLLRKRTKNTHVKINWQSELFPAMNVTWTLASFHYAFI